MEDSMKSMVVDHVLGSSDTVWMPWPVRFQIFFCFSNWWAWNALIYVISWNNAVAQFVLFAFFILSEFEGSVKRKFKKMEGWIFLQTRQRDMLLRQESSSYWLWLPRSCKYPPNYVFLEWYDSPCMLESPVRSRSDLTSKANCYYRRWELETDIS